MTKATHTPGPWLIEGNTVYALSKHDINIFDAELRAGYGDDDHKLSKDVLQANAALIAAAPDLLHAAQWALDHYDGKHMGANTTTLLRAAIAKARGAA